MFSGRSSVLDLLDESLRAIGILQLMDKYQPRFIGDKESTFGQIPLQFQEKLDLEITPSHQYVSGSGITRTSREKKIVHRIPTTYVRVYDFLGCSRNDPFAISNFHAFQNWRTFSDTEWIPKRAFLKGTAYPDISSISEEKKESYYWALRTRMKGSIVVPGILDSAKGIHCKEWLLPNGVTVSADQVKPLAIEVQPRRLYIFERFNYMQTGGTILQNKDGSEVIIPSAQLTQNQPTPASRTLKIYHRGVTEEGISKIHYVIAATLPDNSLYIVDPTSMQFNYRGPAGSIIAHGTWEEYVAGFPGKVLKKVETPLYPTLTDPVTRREIPMKTAIDEMYWFGDGPLHWIQNIIKEINLYRKRRHCAYCGLIEGKHGIRPRPGVCRYEFKPIALSTCSDCKQVGYCELKCQKAHWKAHKVACRAAPVQFNSSRFIYVSLFFLICVLILLRSDIYFK